MKQNTAHKFEKIYANESDSIFRFCLIRVSNREQALDITQEAFLRLWKSMQQGEKFHSSRAFLFTVTRNLIIDWYRKKKSLSLDGLLEGANKPGEKSEAKMSKLLKDTKTQDMILHAEGRYLLEKIDELPTQHSEVVYLRFIEGLPPREIAKVLGISANSASVRINRALVALRKKIRYNAGNV